MTTALVRCRRMLWLSGVSLIAAQAYGVRSAGAQVRPVNATVEPQRIALHEELRIGALEPASHRLVNVQAVCAMSSGRIALLTRSGSEYDLRVFDATGRHVWTRSFAMAEAPHALAVLHDTVAVLVGRYRDAEVHLYVVGRNEPVARIDHPYTRGQSVQLLGSTGAVLVSRTATFGEEDGPSVRPLPVPYDVLRRIEARTPSSPPFLTLFDSAPRVRYPLTTGGRTTVMSLQPPWAYIHSFSIGESELYYARGLRYEVEVFGLDGAARRRMDVPVTVRPFTSELREAWLSAWESTPFVKQLLPDTAVALIRALEPPPNRPIVGGVFASKRGDLLVVRRDLEPIAPPRDSVRLDLVSASGMLRGRIVLAPGTTIRAFTGEHLFVTRVDSTQASGVVSERRAVPLTHVVRFRLDSAAVNR